jgi:hypothetical protein
MGHGRPHQILLFPPPQERGVVLLLLLLFAFFGLIFIYYGMLPEEMSSPSCFRLIVANCLSVTRSCFFFFERFNQELLRFAWLIGSSIDWRPASALFRVPYVHTWSDEICIASHDDDSSVATTPIKHSSNSPIEVSGALDWNARSGSASRPLHSPPRNGGKGAPLSLFCLAPVAVALALRRWERDRSRLWLSRRAVVVGSARPAGATLLSWDGTDTDRGHVYAYTAHRFVRATYVARDILSRMLRIFLIF